MKKGRNAVRWALVFYDVVIILAIEVLLLILYGGSDRPTLIGLVQHSILGLLSIIGIRFLFGIYGTIWRYGGVQNYMRLMFSDGVAFIVYFILGRFILPVHQLTFVKMLALVAMSLLGSLAIRMAYRYAFKCCNNDSLWGRTLLFFLKTFGRIDVVRYRDVKKIRVAILGAGNLGNNLFDEIAMDNKSPYEVRCFIDGDKAKVGRHINGVVVLDEDTVTPETLIQDYNVQEVFFAIHNYSQDKMRHFYETFTKAGIKVKNYDVPHMQSGGDKPQLKEFEIEELLFRTQKTVINEKTASYYRNKTILITGGGGSIGSELCRQIAKMEPKKLIILDIYENCAYDIQQELKMTYGSRLDLSVEIVSITNRKGMARVFETYRPDIVINAAAHKHVPLMEHNCAEAVENNVFGCLNVIQLCEEYGASRFMMVSTDKAVNPTNVMGATKRMCEMIEQAYSTRGRVRCSATRFGNVLGSAGSVIPLFKRQIASGGPVTITDKRIIRYFMTIPEASQLVLESGAMADNGELFVLDMGKPVKIMDLATNMISLMGARNIEIVETGLRPGEKLYEELSLEEELDERRKTGNDKIFVTKPLEIDDEQLEKDIKAIDTLKPEEVRDYLKRLVPNYRGK